MAERKDQKDLQLGNAAARAGALFGAQAAQRAPPARRDDWAATVQFATGCNRGSYVANLMAAPEMSGTGEAEPVRAEPAGSGNGGGGTWT